MSRNKTIAVLLIFLTIVLTGCWDKEEVEKRAYVVALGLDRFEEGNEKEGEWKVQVTFEIANPEVGSSVKGSSQTEEAQEIVTFTASDYITARDTANAFVARKISFSHLDVIIVSEDLAKDKNFLRMMYGTVKDREIRRNTKLIISKDKAADFISNNSPKLETRPHKYYQFMTERGSDTGLVPYSDLHHFFQVLEGDADLFLAMYATTEKGDIKHEHEDEYLAGQIPKQGGNVTQFIGSAVFRERQIVHR